MSSWGIFKAIPDNPGQQKNDRSETVIDSRNEDSKLKAKCFPDNFLSKSRNLLHRDCGRIRTPMNKRYNFAFSLISFSGTRHALCSEVQILACSSWLVYNITVRMIWWLWRIYNQLLTSQFSELCKVKHHTQPMDKHLLTLLTYNLYRHGITSMMIISIYKTNWIVTYVLTGFLP